MQEHTANSVHQWRRRSVSARLIRWGERNNAWITQTLIWLKFDQAWQKNEERRESHASNISEHRVLFFIFIFDRFVRFNRSKSKSWWLTEMFGKPTKRFKSKLYYKICSILWRLTPSREINRSRFWHWELGIDSSLFHLLERPTSANVWSFVRWIF